MLGGKNVLFICYNGHDYVKDDGVRNANNIHTYNAILSVMPVRCMFQTNLLNVNSDDHCDDDVKGYKYR